MCGRAEREAVKMAKRGINHKGTKDAKDSQREYFLCAFFASFVPLRFNSCGTMPHTVDPIVAEGLDTMSQNPIILTIRFVLELAALAAMGYWGWTQHDGLLRVLLAVGLPLLAAALWGVFRVSGYPKDAPVEVPGVVRLLLEVAFFGVGAALLAAAGQRDAALVLAAVVVLHYAASYDYVLALLRNQRGS